MYADQHALNLTDHSLEAPMKNVPPDPLGPDPKKTLEQNPLFERPTPDSRQEALIQVMNMVTKKPPLNFDSPIVIVAPMQVHNAWRFAAREVCVGRYVEVKHVMAFAKMAPTLEIQWLIVVDDIYPDQRPYLAKAIRTLNPNLGHRMFPVTTQYKNPDAANAAGFQILGTASPPLTNPYSVPGPDEDTNK
jgi:hypothetical protein